MGEGWQLLKIRGIPLRIHPTWFVILFVATLAFEQHYRLSLSGQVSPGLVWAVALTTAVMLFVSVLLHELGHSLVALSQGVRVRSITLFLLGGVASVERECSTAMGALLVAAAGPAVSLVLAIGLLFLGHPASHLSPVLGEMVNQLGALNLVLALFNLLPGLPLDGGLIVKAMVWQITGSQRRGLEVANTCGRLLAYLAIFMGSLLLLRGSGLAGAWLMLLGWFGLGAARNQNQLLKLQQALKELKVKDVAQRRFRVVEASISLRQLSRLRLDDTRNQSDSPGGSSPLSPEASPASQPDWVFKSALNGVLPATGTELPDWILVCDRGRWQGLIDDGPLRELPVQRWDSERVGDHLRPLNSLASIPDSAPLWQAALELENHPRLLVLSPAGLPCGTVERPELGEAVLRRLGLRLPAPLLATARRQSGYPLGLALGQIARGMVGTGEVGADSPSAQGSQAAPVAESGLSGDRR
ncbi:MAG: site-2 protease family protein [Cyanobium sp.]